MASFTDRILRELARRLEAEGIPTDVRSLRFRREGRRTFAVVIDATETKRLVTHLHYQVDVTVHVVVGVGLEEAVADAQDNPMTLLDNELTRAERAVLAAPNDLGLAAHVTVRTLAKERSPATANNTAQGALQLQVRYRHDHDNPETYTLPQVVGA